MRGSVVIGVVLLGFPIGTVLSQRGEVPVSAVVYKPPEGVSAVGAPVPRLAGLGVGAVVSIAGAGLQGAGGVLRNCELSFLGEQCSRFAYRLLVPCAVPHVPSLYSWEQNRKWLSRVPVQSEADRQLVSFLEQRWLAKSTGFLPQMIDWLHPLYGVYVQAHPETTHSYARNPANHFSQTYLKRADAWKQTLPEPQDFPLVLTRPFDVEPYLQPKILSTREQLAELQLEGPAFLDITALDMDREAIRSELVARGIDLNCAICIKREMGEGIGGIRLVPMGDVQVQHQFLLERISYFGLTANRIELDRVPPVASASEREPLQLRAQTHEAFLSKMPEPRDLLTTATVKLLRGILAEAHPLESEVRETVVQLSLAQIEQQMQALEEPFYPRAFQLEQVHAHLCPLLEIYSPFTAADFAAVCRAKLQYIPPSLRKTAHFGVHTAGMTCLGGILRAVEESTEGRPLILYGQNTYYENLAAAKIKGETVAVEEATEADWAQVDLLLAHFNPVLSLDPCRGDYRVEAVADSVRRALVGRTKPLTLALDSTVDYINSERAGAILREFQGAIEAGQLNVVVYRSGLKFDLFGMDHYCGAPYAVIHSDDPCWAPFDARLADPALQTDRLSLNWFCLAYKSAFEELEAYRTEVFANTRALLQKMPTRLLTDPEARYQVSGAAEGADLAFIDLKVRGPLHPLRGSLLLGALLYTGCMEAGHPIFTRLSFGFFHPNFFVMPGEETTTIRLTLGLDPGQVEVLAGCFQQIDAWNH